MILSIYKVIEEETGRTFYDLELNNFICAFGTEQNLSKIITSIEEKSSPLIYEDLVSLPVLYSNSTGDYSITLIISFEFENAGDMRDRLRSVIESSHPELLI